MDLPTTNKMYVSGFKNIIMELEDLNLPLDLNIEGPST